MRNSLILLVMGLLTFPSWAQKKQIQSSYYVENLDLSTMRRLNERFDVEYRNGQGFEVIIPREKRAELLRIVPGARLLENDIDDFYRRMDVTQPGWRSLYRNFDSVQKELKDIATKYPDLARLEEYGKDENGRPLLALKLTGDPFVIDKPEVLLTSATHGNEVTTVEVVMDFIQELVQGYKKDSRLTKLLDLHVVYFIPVVCPDGYSHYTRQCGGLDPNRDYPYPGNESHQSIAAIKHETLWFAKHKIAGSLDIHSNLATVMYPWAYTSAPPSADDVPRFKDIGKKMAQDTGYNFGQIAAVFGIARGSSADYWYWKGKTLAFGYEIGDGFLTSRSEIRDLIRKNRDAFLHFIEFF